MSPDIHCVRFSFEGMCFNKYFSGNTGEKFLGAKTPNFFHILSFMENVEVSHSLKIITAFQTCSVNELHYFFNSVWYI